MYDQYFKKWRQMFNAAKSIKKEDWLLFDDLIKRENIQTVLEFGCGLSTWLFEAAGCSVWSLETDREYLLKVASQTRTPRVCYAPWDNKTIPEDFYQKYDFALVDGDNPRDAQILYASKCAPIVIVHDGYTRPYPKYIQQYMSDWQEEKVESVRSRLFRKHG